MEWSDQENRQYISFLRDNLELAKDEELRKKYQIFAMMSKVIPTRKSNQIKSRHQKLCKKYGSLDKILEAL